MLHFAGWSTLSYEKCQTYKFLSYIFKPQDTKSRIFNWANIRNSIKALKRIFEWLLLDERNIKANCIEALEPFETENVFLFQSIFADQKFVKD